MVTQFHAADTENRWDVPLPLLSPSYRLCCWPYSTQVLGKSICQPGRGECDAVQSMHRAYTHAFVRSSAVIAQQPHHPLPVYGTLTRWTFLGELPLRKSKNNLLTLALH